jgi:hypothetical protein
LGGLGAKEGPPVLYTWRALPLGDSAVLSGVFSWHVLPWLTILGLCLLKPNRRWQAWLVWLPLLAVAGLVLFFDEGLSISDSSTREMVRLLAMALGFGWAATLLLAPWAPWPPKLGRWGSLLLILGVFALPGLAFGRNWGEGMFDEIMQLVCAVVLQFVVFALATAASFAGWSVRRRFTIPGFLGWLFLWLIVVWLILAIPCVILTSFGRGEVVTAVLIIAGCCSVGSLVVSLPFLALGTLNLTLRQRLQQVVMPPETAAAQPVSPG